MTRGGLAPARLPTARPVDLTPQPVGVDCWRIDGQAPADWVWEAFSTPRYRFDSADGSARVRYAGFTARGAARERWDPDRTIADADATSWLVNLQGTINVVDLRQESILDALGLDDRVNTARDPDTWKTCQLLGDLLRGWFGSGLDGIIFRSRTTPETSANIAWHNPDGLTVVTADRLHTQGSLLDRLVINDGFTVRFDW